MTFSSELNEIMHRNPDAPFVEYKGEIFTKGDYAAIADRIAELLEAAAVDPASSIGVVVRNRPGHGAALLGLIANGRWLTSIYAIQAPDAIGRELAESRFAAVIADAEDWTPPVIAAAKGCGTLGIALIKGAKGERAVALVPGLESLGQGPFRKVEGEPGLEILSSGTTGKPKRIVFPMRMLVRSVESLRALPDTGRKEPDIMCWPYGGIGGMGCLIGSAFLERYSCLIEKFDVTEWADAVERLKPGMVTGMPAMARMILDADVPKEKLASIRYFYGGSAPFPPDLQAQFEAAYGIAVIWAYGATEFCGTIISWTPELHRHYRDTKLGAMGRATPGVSLRVTDMESGQELPPGQDGFLEARVASMGDEWVKTTDIICIDTDGFVFHKGRGDGAILRGGHKILPEKVVEVLRSHPAVLDAAVIGLDDHRLGAVPVAAVETRSGFAPPGAEALKAHVRDRLTAPQVPVRIYFVPSLPRTTSMKVDLKAVRTLFEDTGSQERVAERPSEKVAE